MAPIKYIKKSFQLSGDETDNFPTIKYTKQQYKLVAKPIEPKELSSTERHELEKAFLAKSLTKLQLRILPTALTKVLQAKLDTALKKNVSIKLIHEILQENSAIFPQDLPIQEALGKKKLGLMWPRGITNLHPAAALLHQYSDHGCPVDCGEDWAEQQITVAILRGLHISAHNPIARQCLIEEALEKERGGYAKIIKFKDIKNNMPKHLKYHLWLWFHIRADYTDAS